MKRIKYLSLILILSTLAYAHPHHRHYPARAYHGYHQAYYPYSWPFSYWGFCTSLPPIRETRTQTTTTYPQGLVVLSSTDVSEDINRMNLMRDEGILTNKEFERAKNTLLNRIGMTVNPNSSALNPGQILDEIEALKQMHRKQLINLKEFKSQKKRLLAQI